MVQSRPIVSVEQPCAVYFRVRDVPWSWRRGQIDKSHNPDIPHGRILSILGKPELRNCRISTFCTFFKTPVLPHPPERLCSRPSSSRDSSAAGPASPASSRTSRAGHLDRRRRSVVARVHHGLTRTQKRAGLLLPRNGAQGKTHLISDITTCLTEPACAHIGCPHEILIVCRQKV